MTSTNPVTFPRTCMRPTIALAKPTCFSDTMSGTYPWNGPRATLVEKDSSAMNAARATTLFAVAIPARKTTSSSEPITM